MIHPSLGPTWSHSSASFTILGDAAHATLLYLASGAGMSLEDGHVLGLCLGAMRDRTTTEKRKALIMYERCRRKSTERVVERGNEQQALYHLHDGEEQQKRDRLHEAFGEFNENGLVEQEQFEAKGLRDGTDPLAWRWGGLGKWLLTYVCEDDFEKRKREIETERRNCLNLEREWREGTTMSNK